MTEQDCGDRGQPFQPTQETPIGNSSCKASHEVGQGCITDCPILFFPHFPSKLLNPQ